MIALAIVLWALLIGALLFAYYARYVEPSNIVVTERTIRIPHLPEALRGLRIVHLSDFHCQRKQSIERSSRRAVELAMGLNADLIVITGDLFDICNEAAHCSYQLEGLSAPLGVWAVPGNHDMAHNDPFTTMQAPPEKVEVLRRVLSGLGIRLLENASETIAVDGARLAIAGSDDLGFGRDDVAAAMRGTAGADLVILLGHTPDIIDDPHAAGADLLLCGHTHGGQIQLPGIGSPWAPVWRDRRRAAGLLRANGQLCYVSRGVASATRARFNCHPEVALLTLERGEETEAIEVPVRRNVSSHTVHEEAAL
jgi:predicted MPP superfamily phosphohydrolase